MYTTNTSYASNLTILNIHVFSLVLLKDNFDYLYQYAITKIVWWKFITKLCIWELEKDIIDNHDEENLKNVYYLLIISHNDNNIKKSNQYNHHQFKISNYLVEKRSHPWSSKINNFIIYRWYIQVKIKYSKKNTFLFRKSRV